MTTYTGSASQKAKLRGYVLRRALAEKARVTASGVALFRRTHRQAKPGIRRNPATHYPVRREEREQMETTLNFIRAQSPCPEGWQKLLLHMGKTKADDEPLELLTVLDSNGLDDALWTLQCVPNCDRDARLFAVWCARQVQHLMTDQRSLDALDVAERFANGEATDSELAAARDAAWDSARDAAAAWAAAWAAARSAARSAAMYAWDSASSAARSAARSAQKAMFIQMCNGTAPWQESRK